jgi:hypothetical protein
MLLDPSARVLDNSIPISAWGFYDNPHAPYLERYAEYAFRDFVDAYVNTPVRMYLLPNALPVTPEHGAPDLHEPLVRLWQDGATLLPAADPVLPQVTAEHLVWDFGFRLRYPSLWVGWIACQFQPRIDEGFFFRVPDWQEKFDQVTGEIRRLLATKELRPFVRQLRQAISQQPFHHHFREFMAIRHIDPITLATARAYDWFRRGYSYAGLTAGYATLFHPLRQAAARVATPVLNPCRRIQREFRFGAYLAAHRKQVLRNGLPAEPLIQGLRRLRTLVQSPEWQSNAERKPREEQLRAVVESGLGWPVQERRNPHYETLVPLGEKAALLGWLGMRLNELRTTPFVQRQEFFWRSGSRVWDFFCHEPPE